MYSRYYQQREILGSPKCGPHYGTEAELGAWLMSHFRRQIYGLGASRRKGSLAREEKEGSQSPPQLSHGKCPCWEQSHTERKREES